jgi:CRISPR/Cas system-associated endonuclease Cas1
LFSHVNRHDAYASPIAQKGKSLATRERYRDPFNANAACDWLGGLDGASSVSQLITIEAQAAMCYWRAFKDMGLREAKGGNLPRPWLRFANRQKGAKFLGSKHASPVWDAIEPLRPAIDKRVFGYIASREFARYDFIQFSATTFRLSRNLISEMLGRASLSEREIADAADFMLQMVKRHAGGKRRLFKPDMRK